MVDHLATASDCKQQSSQNGSYCKSWRCFMGTVNRAKWARVMMRVINPAWAREVMMPVTDASQQLFDKAHNEVLNMFAGNQPNFVDKNDPTAASLLQTTELSDAGGAGRPNGQVM